MNKTELIAAAAEKAGVSKKEAEAVVTAAFDAVVNLELETYGVAFLEFVVFKSFLEVYSHFYVISDVGFSCGIFVKVFLCIFRTVCKVSAALNVV